MAEEGISVFSRFRKPLSQPCSRKQRFIVVSRASICLIYLGSQIDSQSTWVGGSESVLPEYEKSGCQDCFLMALWLVLGPWDGAAFVFLVFSEGKCWIDWASGSTSESQWMGTSPSRAWVFTLRRFGTLSFQAARWGLAEGRHLITRWEFLIRTRITLRELVKFWEETK